MRIIGVIIEAIDPIGANITVGGNTEDPSKGEGDNKIIIEDNFKVTVDSLILLMVVITIITMAIIKVEVAWAMVVTFIDHAARRSNYRGHNNYQYHQYYMHDDGLSYPQITTDPVQDTLYPQMNNNIEYGLFENVIDSYYFDGQIRDDFQCIKTCYTYNTTAGSRHSNLSCTHAYDHIS